MSEAGLWDYLRNGMGAAWESQRHEDRLSMGIPDVSYSISCHGWIELKDREDVPKRASTPVTLPHYTADQRNWLERHGKRGGRCFILLQVANEYMLFDWRGTACVGRVPMAELRAAAVAVWIDRIDFKALRRLLD